MLENIELFGNSLGTGTYPDGEGKSFLQNIFDVIHPVGEVYIQYPAQKSPQEIYNKKDANNRIIIDSVWEEQLQYNSAFFRSEHLLGSYVYKANDETQYYLIDNSNNLTPINITGNSSISIAGSPTAGQQKVVGDKTYQAYAVSGVNSSSSDYIKEGNGLIKQENQNLSHKHNTNGNTGSESSHTHNMVHYHSSGSLRIQGSSGSYIICENADVTSGSNALRFHSGERTNSIGSSGQHYWAYGTLSLDTNNSGSWSGLTSSTVNSSGTAITNTGAGSSHSHSVNLDTDSKGGTEARPDNYTYRIWKRIL